MKEYCLLYLTDLGCLSPEQVITKTDLGCLSHEQVITKTIRLVYVASPLKTQYKEERLVGSESG